MSYDTILGVLVVVAAFTLLYVAYQLWRPVTRLIRKIAAKSLGSTTPASGKPAPFLKPSKFWLTMDVVIFTSPLWVELLIHIFLTGLAYAIAQGVVTFLLVFLVLSPFYAVASAKAFDAGNQTLITFVKRYRNRLFLRKKGERYLDFVGHILPGRTFAGLLDATLDREENAFWRLADCKGAEAPVGSEVHKLRVIRGWLAYINVWYDVALVGVRGIVEVNERPIEKYRSTKVVDTDPVTNAVTSSPRLRIIPPVLGETTNHIRVAPERWVVYIEQGEVKGARIPVDLVVVLYIRCINPMQQERFQANWSQFLNDAVIDIALRALRGLTLEEMLDLEIDTTGTRGAEASDPVIQEIRRIKKRLEDNVGITIDDATKPEEADYSGGVQIMSLSIHTRNERETTALSLPWVAGREKQAAILKGEGEATAESGVAKAVAEVIREYGEAGIVARETDAIGHAAESAKNATLMANFGRSGSQGAAPSTSASDQLLMQLIAQMQQQGRTQEETLVAIKQLLEAQKKEG